jgi:hypothetical protein
MKQLVLIENSDIQTMKNGERLTVNVEGTEFLLGYLGVPRNTTMAIDSEFEEEPPRTGDGRPKRRCPFCNDWITPNNYTRHLVTHKGEKTQYKQRRVPCKVCGRVMGGSGMATHMKFSHPDDYKKEQANG